MAEPWPAPMGGAAPAALTPGEALRWLLRNLAILLGAFLPAVVFVMFIGTCVADAERGERCGTGMVGEVMFVWMALAIPVCIIGGIHLTAVLQIAGAGRWRGGWPRRRCRSSCCFPAARRRR